VSLERPNILVLCTDQQRFDAVGAYGNPHIQTPNMDRLASEGTLFERCYVPNPVCAPSRASLLTGRWPSAHGLWANGVALPDHERLVTQDLADAGYDCGLVGKLHLAACEDGRTEARRDDGFRVFRWAHDPYPGSPENAYHRWLQATDRERYEAAVTTGTQAAFDTLPAELHYSRWIGDETIDFLVGGRRTDQPFCFFTNFFDPHHGFGAPSDYLDRYDPDALPPPVTWPGELETKPPIQAEASRASYAGHARGFRAYSEQELHEARVAYYAMVTLVDDEIGRVLEALEQAGLADRTLVIFTSDHGEMLGDHQLMLKGPMLYEPAVRVPLILRWPGRVQAGLRRDELVSWVDLTATILDAASLPPPPGNQGESLLPLARGEDAVGWRDWALAAYRNSGHPYDPPVHTTMLRTGSWKLIVHHGEPATERERSGELYDLASDPMELSNLWDDPDHRETRSRLQERLLDVLVATEDRTQPRQASW
jgi:arylsulfatase